MLDPLVYGNSKQNMPIGLFTPSARKGAPAHAQSSKTAPSFKQPRNRETHPEMDELDRKDADEWQSLMDSLLRSKKEQRDLRKRERKNTTSCPENRPPSLIDYTEAGTGTGADAEAGAGAGAGANADADADAGTDAGTGTDADADPKTAVGTTVRFLGAHHKGRAGNRPGGAKTAASTYLFGRSAKHGR